MSFKEIYYTYFRGVRKNTKFWRIILGMCMLPVPHWWYIYRGMRIRTAFQHLSQENRDYIMDRVNYYCHLLRPVALPAKAPSLAEHNYIRRPRIVKHSIYFFDTFAITRYFPNDRHILIQDGDISTEMLYPTITKSRPVAVSDKASFNVLLKLNKVRHFIFFQDPFSWEEKKGIVLFRGVIFNKENRRRFVEKYGDNPLCDLKDTHKASDLPAKWKASKTISIYKHLHYRYIMALEGNDVASNLKWVMSSNSIAVMPKPTCETWFMEGRLLGDYHYIEIKPDYSDLLEKIEYYENHPDEAKEIIRHAHEWVSQFCDSKREEMIGVMTLDKYFLMTDNL